MAIRAKSDRIFNYIWSSIRERLDMMHFQIRTTVIQKKGGGMFASVAATVGLLKNPCHNLITSRIHRRHRSVSLRLRGTGGLTQIATLTDRVCALKKSETVVRASQKRPVSFKLFENNVGDIHTNVAKTGLIVFYPIMSILVQNR